MKVRTMRLKVIVSGRRVEGFRYRTPVLCEPQSGGKSRVEATPEERKEWRVRYRQKTFYYLLRLIEANFTDVPDVKFITATFAENVRSVVEANKHFKKFIQRLRHRFGDGFKYIATIEFQKRGAVHYHILADIPYVKNDDLRDKVWKNGFTAIRAVKDADHAAAYAGKYMKKGVLDERLAGKKAFWCSRNLKYPLVLRNEAAERFLEQIPDEDKEKYSERSYRSEYTGEVDYNRFYLKHSARSIHLLHPGVNASPA